MSTIEVKSLSLKAERHGTFGEYEVTGWRYVDDVSWHVKVWPAGCPRDWFGYIVAPGQCGLNILNEVERAALSDVIAKWET
jgi:hypothetical protein